MTHRIATTQTLSSIADLNGEWKIAATRDAVGWNWPGAMQDAARWFNKAIYPEPGDDPKVSCVTGRDPDGREVLYARVYPAHLGAVSPRPPRPPRTAAEWRRYR